MTDPIFIEKAFNTLMSALLGLHSKREKLFAISDFLQLIRRNISINSGYVEQILSYIPKFDHVYEATGIDPARLKEVHETLTDCLSNLETAEAKLENIKSWTTKVYEWVGVRDSEWMNDSISIFDSKLPIQQNIHTVLVPVIESTSHNKSGRLRNLVIKTIGNTPSNEHELTKIFSVLSSENDASKNGNVQSAVNALIIDLELTKKKHWQATASFEHNDAWHSGNSADLALAGLFFCSILEAMDLKEQFRLNPAIAITGELNNDGSVEQVSSNTLRQKVEAAFYSWTQILVVPEQQVSTVYGIYDRLKIKYPNRDLIIIGVRHIKDLFYDRRLTLHTKKGAIEHARSRIWEKKFSAIAVLAYVFLLFIITALIVGPIDSNPDHYEYTNDEIVILNNLGRELNRIPVTEHSINQATKINASNPVDIIKIHDFNDDGKNEILLNYLDESHTDNKLILMSSDMSDTLWVNEMEFEVEYEKHPDMYIHEYRISKLYIENVDTDPAFEIIATIDQQIHFQGHVIIIDSETGEVEQRYLGAGWFAGVQVEDFDKDGVADILICGHYKGFDYWGCSLLDATNIDGFTPLSERYFDQNKPRANEKFIVVWKGTVIKSILDSLASEFDSNPSLYRILNDIHREFITITFSEGAIGTRANYDFIPILKTFDYRFNPVSFASSDTYDKYALQFYEEGLIPFIADAQYLHGYKDSLYYWNGADWIQEPTLNPRYLESVGEDSTYYLNWYFKKE